MEGVQARPWHQPRLDEQQIEAYFTEAELHYGKCKRLLKAVHMRSKRFFYFENARLMSDESI